MAQPILWTENVALHFGGVVAVDKVSISIKPGQIFGLIGPNGAGKTTMFNLLTGIYKPTAGKMFFKEKDITTLPTHEITKLGISRTFQNIRLLKGQSVFDNVLIATHYHLQYNFISALFQTSTYRSQEQKARRMINDLLDRFNLTNYRSDIATDLPQGIQRKVEIIRALATGAELIFLDEPAAGLNPVETTELMSLIKQIRDEGKTVLLIEHDMKLVKGVCDEIAVLNFGQLIDQGSYDKVTKNPRVVQAYLGRRYENAQSL